MARVLACEGRATGSSAARQWAMLRKSILVASLLAVLIGTAGTRLWTGVAAWCLCALVLASARDTTTASIGAWSSAVVALVLLA